MNVTFISPSPHVNKIHAYGVRLLSACLKRAGCQVDIIFLPRQLGELYSARVLDQIVELTAHADLVGLSVMTDDYENAVRITEALKRTSTTPVIWGGIHPTLLPQECLRHADMVCIGEGEDALLELVERLRDGLPYADVHGIWVREGAEIRRNPLRPLIQDLDRLPYPDYDPARHFVLHEGEIRPLTRDLQELCLQEYYLTLTTRGCPSHCTYCWNHAYNRIFPESHRIRKRSVDHVIGELRAIATEFPFIELICIDDDAFFMRKADEIAEFSAKYKQHVGIPMWVTGAAPTTISDEKLKSLSEAGLVSVRMGIQSGSERTKRLYKRVHSNRSVLKAVELLHRYRAHIKRRQFDVILDNPWETDEDLRDTLMLLSRLPLPYELIIFPLMFYPGTDLAQRAQQEGLVTIQGAILGAAGNAVACECAGGGMPQLDAEFERIRAHRFRTNYLNRIFFLLDECARHGVRIDPLQMRLLIAPWARRTGVSEWWMGRVRKRLEAAKHRAPETGRAYIDFAEDAFASQLGAGWHSWERTEGGGFRWTERRCTFYLFPTNGERRLQLDGFVPQFEHYRRAELKVEICEGRRVIAQQRLRASGAFSFDAPLTEHASAQGEPRTFQLRLNGAFTPAELGLGPDVRQLGAIVRSARLV